MSLLNATLRLKILQHTLVCWWEKCSTLLENQFLEVPGNSFFCKLGTYQENIGTCLNIHKHLPFKNMAENIVSDLPKQYEFYEIPTISVVAS